MVFETLGSVKDLQIQEGAADGLIRLSGVLDEDERIEAKKSMLDSFAGRRILSLNYFNKKKENIESYLNSAPINIGIKIFLFSELF